MRNTITLPASIDCLLQNFAGYRILQSIHTFSDVLFNPVGSQPPLSKLVSFSAISSTVTH